MRKSRKTNTVHSLTRHVSKQLGPAARCHHLIFMRPFLGGPFQTPSVVNCASIVSLKRQQFKDAKTKQQCWCRMNSAFSFKLHIITKHSRRFLAQVYKSLLQFHMLCTILNYQLYIGLVLQTTISYNWVIDYE